MPNSEPIGAAIVREADSWIGTPYCHQQRVRGVGVDCAGLVIGVGLALGIIDWTPERFAPFARYSRVPNPRRFMAAIETFLIPAPDEALKSGRVAIIAWKPDWPMHLGIIDASGPVPYLIHAFEHRSRCCKHVIDREWRARICAVWQYPGAAA